MLKRNKLGQSTAEYAIVIGLVIAAAVAMQIYIKRAIQGKVRGAVDYSPDATVFKTKQFEPDYAASDMDVAKKSEVSTETLTKGQVIRTVEGEGEITTRSGTQKTLGLDENGNVIQN